MTPIHAVARKCWKHLPEHHVMTLYSGKKLGEELMAQGILDISNNPGRY